MAINIDQVTGTTGSTAFLTRVPSGAYLILSTNDPNADIVWGTSSAVTFTTGAFVPPGTGVMLTNPVTSPPFDVWVISGTGGHPVTATVITRN